MILRFSGLILGCRKSRPTIGVRLTAVSTAIGIITYRRQAHGVRRSRAVVRGLLTRALRLLLYAMTPIAVLTAVARADRRSSSAAPR